MSDIEIIAVLGTLLSKKYGKDLFKLLKVYRDISASEASSRLGLHVQTVQEFLESTASIGLTEKKEVLEKKRPYYRYNLVRDIMDLQFNINELLSEEEAHEIRDHSMLIREKKNATAHYTTARTGSFFSAISVTEGLGRQRKHRRINLTNAQGKFLFHLPFPDAEPMTIERIMKDAEVESEHKLEVEDLVKELVTLKVIEVIS